MPACYLSSNNLDCAIAHPSSSLRPKERVDLQQQRCRKTIEIFRISISFHRCFVYQSDSQSETNNQLTYDFMLQFREPRCPSFLLSSNIKNISISYNFFVDVKKKHFSSQTASWHCQSSARQYKIQIN